MITENGNMVSVSPADAVNAKADLRKVTSLGLLVAFGIVFGDIGTSPLYVMNAIVRVRHGYDADYIIGAVSCIIWTLTLLTTVKYVIIALRADNNGEGGILALYSLVKKSRHKWLYIVAAIGASTLVADGVITPAVTVTSAIEGLGSLSGSIPVTGIVIVIITVIFVIQMVGTHTIGKWFGPVMLLWFVVLGVFGSIHIADCPDILKAFNPWYAVRLLVHYPGWFLILGAVFLCTTGAEALYSDLGHCGRMNISMAWILVKIMLILNYLGQGAWLIRRIPEPLGDINPFYGIVPHLLLIPGIILATLAAIIASQALISGSFTIFSEAIGLKFWPRMKIKYPSVVKGQLYIPAINFFLYAGCVATVLIFGSSANMEAAYGLAITVTMLMTTFLLAVYLRHKNVSRWLIGLFIAIFGSLEAGFLIANATKFMNGGWYTILIAGAIAVIILTWYTGNRIKEKFRMFVDVDRFMGVIADISHDREIPKFASNIVYLSHSQKDSEVETRLIYSIINKQPKRADRYWIIRIEHDDAPDTLAYSAVPHGGGLLYYVTMRFGFRVEPRLTLYLRQIVEDLQKRDGIDITSCYPSLRKHGIAGEFRFMVIRRIFSENSVCGKKDRMLMRLHNIISRFALSDVSAYGLDVCNVTEETSPMIINDRRPRRIEYSGES